MPSAQHGPISSVGPVQLLSLTIKRTAPMHCQTASRLLYQACICMARLHQSILWQLGRGVSGLGCRDRVQKLEVEVASLRSSNKRLKAAESSWAEAEARAAAHAGTEEALRYQLTHLQIAVKASFCMLSLAWLPTLWPLLHQHFTEGADTCHVVELCNGVSQDACCVQHVCATGKWGPNGICVHSYPPLNISRASPSKKRSIIIHLLHVQVL